MRGSAPTTSVEPRSRPSPHGVPNPHLVMADEDPTVAPDRARRRRGRGRRPDPGAGPAGRSSRPRSTGRWPSTGPSTPAAAVSPTSQAACYVDKARAKVGSTYLEPGVSVPAAVGQRLTAIRDDCVGLAGLGARRDAPAVSVPGTEAGLQPLRHGQDPALDALVVALRGRVGRGLRRAVRPRRRSAPQYEQFALTCGGRTPQMRCAAVYRLPHVRTRQRTTSRRRLATGRA